MKPVTRTEIKQIVRLLDKMSRVMATMKMRHDLLDFGQTQIVKRLYQLEQSERRQARRKAR